MREIAEARELVCIYKENEATIFQGLPKVNRFLCINPKEPSELDGMKQGLLQAGPKTFQDRKGVTKTKPIVFDNLAAS